MNLPKRSYSYGLCELTNWLTIDRAYNATSSFIEKFFHLKLSVSALETITTESSTEYDNFNKSIKENLVSIATVIEGSKIEQGQKKEIEFTTKELQNEIPLRVVSFDGVGVPMIKKEAAKIKARNGRGEKKQKKKEAQIGRAHV